MIACALGAGVVGAVTTLAGLTALLELDTLVPSADVGPLLQPASVTKLRETQLKITIERMTTPRMANVDHHVVPRVALVVVTRQTDCE